MQILANFELGPHPGFNLLNSGNQTFLLKPRFTHRLVYMEMQTELRDSFWLRVLTRILKIGV